MSLSKGSNRNTAKETHLNGRKFDPFNTNILTMNAGMVRTLNIKN